VYASTSFVSTAAKRQSQLGCFPYGRVQIQLLQPCTINGHVSHYTIYCTLLERYCSSELIIRLVLNRKERFGGHSKVEQPWTSFHLFATFCRCVSPLLCFIQILPPQKAGTNRAASHALWPVSDFLCSSVSVWVLVLVIFVVFLVMCNKAMYRVTQHNSTSTRVVLLCTGLKLATCQF